MKNLFKTLKPKLHTVMFINSSMKNQTENVFNESYEHHKPMHNISIDSFTIFAQNIDCGYTYPQSIFCVKTKKKKLGIPRKPQFYYTNVGFKGIHFTDMFS